MEINKKYLITNGCSFTEGHHMGEIASWPKHLGEFLNLEVINLGKGGSGNDTIINNTIHFGDVNKEIAEDAFFVIGLTECLRYSVSIDLGDDKPIPFVFTPLQFLFNIYGDKKFDGWDMKHQVCQWVFDNRYVLAPIFTNITERLYNTLMGVVNISNWCEKNNYPYLIFDAINNHIPIQKNDKWYLRGSNPDNEMFSIEVANDIQKYRSYSISDGITKEFIQQIKDLKFYYNDKTLMDLLIENPSYVKGNDGHPNQEAAVVWAKYLEKVIYEL